MNIPTRANYEPARENKVRLIYANLALVLVIDNSNRGDRHYLSGIFGHFDVASSISSMMLLSA